MVCPSTVDRRLQSGLISAYPIASSILVPQVPWTTILNGRSRRGLAVAAMRLRLLVLRRNPHAAPNANERPMMMMRRLLFRTIATCIVVAMVAAAVAAAAALLLSIRCSCRPSAPQATMDDPALAAAATLL